jgi:sugar lactone lactonase YvrE
MAAAALVLSLAACSEDDDGSSARPFSVRAASDVGATNPAGAVLAVTFAVTDVAAAPRPGVEIDFFSEGGGRVDATATTDGEGNATVSWTLGVAPVRNRLAARIEDDETVVDTLATLDAPLSPRQFGDIPALIAAEMLPGSTEDLAFDGERRLLLGIGGGLIEMDADGNAALVELSGEPIEAPLGIAYDAAGNLWVADSRDGPTMPAPGALLRVSPAGVVTTVLTSVGDEDLVGPNYVAIGGDGKVYLSDPCLGAVFRYAPESGAVDAEVRFDVATQGGPNGLVFSPSDGSLFLATESIALLCGRADVDPTLVDPVAGLFRVPVGATGFGEIEPLAERMGLFGDGVAFDRLGNLYVIFDTEENLALAESAVWVYPAGESGLVKFLAASDRVFANIAFGRGAFGDQTMYLSLLAIDAFGLPLRGVERIDIGIAGASLPH